MSLPAYRRTARCSEALIVVSDGGSSDQTVPIVERIASTDPRVRVLTTVERLRTGASVNRAVERFGDGRTWLVRLDAHAEYPKDYASRLVAKAIETGASSVVTTDVHPGPYLLPARRSCSAELVSRHWGLGPPASQPRRLGGARPSRDD